jgi:Zn-dependent peptidase ImmA (M78 family)/transcriptional regulator with XRE-family HTH domain
MLILFRALRSLLRRLGLLKGRDRTKMPMTQTEFGSKLRQARIARARTLAEAAATIGLEPADIEAIERGERLVGGSDFEKLCKLYGRDAALFFSPNDPGVQVAQAMTRISRGTADEAQIDAAVSRCLQAYYALAALKRICRIEPSASRGIRATLPETPGEAYAQGVKAAAAERGRLGLGTIAPADPWQLVQGQGIDVCYSSLPAEISGLMLSQTGSAPFVVLNEREPAVRWTFSLAHEYAHVLLDRHELAGTISRKDQDTTLREIRANAFASSFLVPTGGIKAYLAEEGRLAQRKTDQVVIRPDDVLALAGRFAVSREAILHQLRRMRYVDERQSVDLMRDIKSIWKGGFPIVDMHYRIRARILDLAAQAYRTSEMTDERLAEYLTTILDGATEGELAAITDAGKVLGAQTAWIEGR